MRRLLLCLVALGLLLPGPAPAAEGGPGRKIVVAAVVNPPFVRRTPRGGFEGLSIDLLRATARSLGWTLEFKLATFEDVYTEIGSGAATLAVGAISPTPGSLPLVDFSLSYMHPSIGIMTKKHGALDFRRVLAQLVEPDVARFLGFMGGSLLVTAVLMWLAERRRNPQHFGGRLRSGIGAGLWWSTVTLTAVGYGDIVPRTLAGRALALLWMLLSVVLIATFTGVITTALALGDRSTRITQLADLERVSVAVQSGAFAESLLNELGVDHYVYPTIGAAITALEDGEVEAVVGFDLELRNERAGVMSNDTTVVPQVIERHGIAIAMPPDWPERRRLNEAILAVLDSDLWRSALRNAEFSPADLSLDAPVRSRH